MIFNVILGNTLPTEEFGRLAISLAFFRILNLLTSGTFPALSIRFLSDKRVAPTQKSEIFIKAFIANAGLNLFASLSLFLLFFLGVLGLEEDYFILIVLVVLITSIASLFAIFKGLFLGYFKFLNVAVATLFGILIRIAIGFGLVLLGWGSIGVLFGYSIGFISSSIILIIPSRSLLPRERDSSSDNLWRLLAAFVLYDFVAMNTINVISNVDLIFMKIILPKIVAETLGGYYQVYIILVQITRIIVTSGMSVIFPYLARVESSSGKSDVVLDFVIRMILILFFPFHISLAFIPRSFLQILFPGYLNSSYFLAFTFLSIAWFLFALIIVLTRGLQVLNLNKYPPIILLISLGIQVTLLLFLIPSNTIVGATFSTFIASIIGFLGLWFIFKIKCSKNFRAPLITGIKFSVAMSVFFLVTILIPSQNIIFLSLNLGLAYSFYILMILILNLFTYEDYSFIVSGIRYKEGFLKRILMRTGKIVKFINSLIPHPNIP